MIAVRVKVNVEESFRRGFVSEAETDVIVRKAQLATLDDKLRQRVLDRLRVDAGGELRLYGKRGELLVVPAPTLDGIIEAVRADHRRRGPPAGQ